MISLLRLATDKNKACAATEYSVHDHSKGLNVVSTKYNVLRIGLSSVLLALPAIINGFPIVYWDTGAYISMYSGFESFFSAPIDRTIYYGVFCYYASLNNMFPFLIVFIQSIVLAYLINYFIVFHVNQKFEGVAYFIIIVLITFSYTGLLCSSIMPDIWSSLGLVSTLILMNSASVKLPFQIVIATSVLFAPVNGLIYIFGVIVSAIHSVCRGASLAGHFSTVSVIMLAFIATLIPPYLTYKMITPIPGSCAFLLSSLSTKGILAGEIDKYCVSSPESSLCSVDRDRLKMKDEILWNQTGSELNIWDVNNQDICSFVSNAIKNNFILFTIESVKGAIVQSVLMPNDLRKLYNVNFPFSSSTVSNINKIFPGYYLLFDNSLQQNDASYFNYIIVYKWIMIAFLFMTSFAVIITINNKSFAYKKTVCILMSCCIANLLITSSLQGGDERFNVRVTDISLILFIFLQVKSVLSG